MKNSFKLEEDRIIKDWLKAKDPELLNDNFFSEDPNNTFSFRLALSDEDANDFTYTELVGQYVLELSSLASEFDIKATIRALSFEFDNRATKDGDKVAYRRDTQTTLKTAINGGNFIIKNLYDEKNLKYIAEALLKPKIEAWINANITDKDIKLIYSKWLGSEGSNESIINATKHLATYMYPMSREPGPAVTKFPANM